MLYRRRRRFLDAVSLGDEVGGIFFFPAPNVHLAQGRSRTCSLCLCEQTYIHTMLVSLAQTEKEGTHPDDAILPRF